MRVDCVECVPTTGSDFMLFASNHLASNHYRLASGVPLSSSTNLLIYKTTEPNGIWMPFGPAMFEGLLLDDGALVKVRECIDVCAGFLCLSGSVC